LIAHTLLIIFTFRINNFFDLKSDKFIAVSNYYICFSIFCLLIKNMEKIYKKDLIVEI
jgi:hypothetical protein